eukprot:9955086-Alexandrium_andersonii.AAC.1
MEGCIERNRWGQSPHQFSWIHLHVFKVMQTHMVHRAESVEPVVPPIPPEPFGDFAIQSWRMGL